MAFKRKIDTGPLSGLSLAERKHTHFDDSGDESSPGRQQADVILKKSRAEESREQNILKALHPGTKVVPNTSDESYVLDLALSASEDMLGCATGSSVTSYSIGTTGLMKESQTYKMKGSVTAISFACDSSNCLYACGTGSDLICWDLRQRREALRFLAKGKPLNCLDTSDDLLAVGANGTVLFWDRRKASDDDDAHPSACLAEFSDTHEQEVTQVRFHPEEKVFLSGSEDGLISVFDASSSSSLDEDDGFQAALNLMDSVAAFGFYGERKQRLWCRTFTENLYVWDWRAACSEDQQGGEGPFGSMKNSRDQLATAIHSQNSGGTFEYLLDCCYHAGEDQLRAVAGTKAGSAAAFPMAVEDERCLLQPPNHSMQAGHSAVIRKVVWTQAGVPYTCISGGEDGKVICWDAEALQ